MNPSSLSFKVQRQRGDSWAKVTLYEHGLKIGDELFSLAQLDELQGTIQNLQDDLNEVYNEMYTEFCAND